MTEKDINIEDGEMQEEQPVEEQTDKEAEDADNTNQSEDIDESSESTEPSEEKDPLEKAQEEIADLKNQLLYKVAEFDNYRRRTNKEKLDIMATAGERIFTEMLPLVDDFERGIANLTPTLSQGEGGEAQYEAVVNGMKLIYQKFLSFLDKNDVHPIETEDADFNTDEHEAVTTFAAGDDKKGKVIDCTQKGYKLGEKVIRFAKVVVGE